MAALLLVVVLLLIDGIASAPFGGHLEAAVASEATKMADRGNMRMDARVVEYSEFNSEVRCDLRGHLEVAMASEATKMAVRLNMHMDTRVIKVSDFKSEVI